MAIAGHDMGESENSMTAVVPSGTLAEVGRILQNESTIKISITKAYILFQTESIKMVSRLIEGEYIKYRQIIPAEWQTRFTVSSGRTCTMYRQSLDNLFWQQQSCSV